MLSPTLTQETKINDSPRKTVILLFYSLARSDYLSLGLSLYLFLCLFLCLFLFFLFSLSLSLSSLLSCFAFLLALLSFLLILLSFLPSFASLSGPWDTLRAHCWYRNKIRSKRSKCLTCSKCPETGQNHCGPLSLLNSRHRFQMLEMPFCTPNAQDVCCARIAQTEILVSWGA